MHTLLLLVLRRSHKSLACVSVARRSLRCRQRIRIALSVFAFSVVLVCVRNRRGRCGQHGNDQPQYRAEGVAVEVLAGSRSGHLELFTDFLVRT